MYSLVPVAWELASAISYIQSFSELEIDAMCCVWPDEGGYLYMRLYRSQGGMMGKDMCKSYYAWISHQ